MEVHQDPKVLSPGDTSNLFFQTNDFPPTDSWPTEKKETSRPKKRQKVSSACDSCRSKKIKCDGIRPVCSTCQRRQQYPTICTWGFRKGRGSSASREELSRLERKLQELESERQISEASARDGMALKAWDEQVDGNVQQHNAMLGLMVEKGSDALQTQSNSSVSSFMSHIRNMLDHHSGSHASSAEPKQAARITQPLLATSTSDELAHVDVVLPPHQTADHLLDVYWRLIDPLYPFLDRGQIESMYRRLWAREDLGKDAKVFLCLLNVAFSLSCNLNPLMEPEERSTNAAIFYQRSRGLLDFSDVQNYSILTVQCFLLSGQYLQSTNQPQQCWMVVGMAIRVAQSIGLDLVATSAGAETTRLRETMRKVWHGCILMDRTLSMTFGRPLMIAPEAAAIVPMPLVHNDEGTCNCHSVAFNSDVAQERDLHFFTEALKLYELMSEALLSLYDASVVVEEGKGDEYAAYFGGQAAKVVGQVCEVDGKLRRWQRCLPIHLRHDPDAPKSTIHKRQSHILLLRFHHIRILLLRPVLSRFYSKQDYGLDGFPETLPWTIALHLSVSCVREALETVEFYESNIGNQGIEGCESLLPAWWYSTFYIYSAATILVAAQLHPALTEEVGVKRILDGCRIAMKLLKLLQRFGNHATRCATAIGLLLDHVLPRKQKGRTRQKRQRGPEESDEIRYPAERRQVDDLCRNPVNKAASRTSPAKQHVHGSCINADDIGYVYASLNTPADDAKSLGLGLAFNGNGMDDVTTLDGLMDIDFEGFNYALDFNDLSWLDSIPAQLYEH